MDKAQIVRAIYERKKSTATMKELAVVVDELFAVIGEAVRNGEKVDIAGAGTFDLQKNAIKSLDRFGRANAKAKT